MKKIIGISIISLALLAGAVGCGNNDNDTASENTTVTETNGEKANTGVVKKEEKVEEKSDKDETKTENTSNNKISEDDKTNKVNNSSESSKKQDSVYVTEVAVYGVDENVTELKKTDKSVKVYDKRVAAASLEALASSDWSEGYTSPIPNGLTFEGVNIQDGVAIVKYNYSGGGLGTAGESAFVGSVVYTLTEFPTIQSVKFEASGTDAITHFDSSSAFTRDSVAGGLNIVN